MVPTSSGLTHMEKHTRTKTYADNDNTWRPKLTLGKNEPQRETNEWVFRFSIPASYMRPHTHGLMQKGWDYIAAALELHIFCIKPAIRLKKYIHIAFVFQPLAKMSLHQNNLIRCDPNSICSIWSKCCQLPNGRYTCTAGHCCRE